MEDLDNKSRKEIPVYSCKHQQLQNDGINNI